MSAVPLYLGASHASAVGKVVSVDVDAVERRTIFTGILHGTRDTYSQTNGDVETTTLYVGRDVVTLDWSDGTLTVELETEE